MVCLSVGQSTMTVSPAKTDEPIEICRLVCGLGGPLQTIGILWRELCKNGWTDEDAVWEVDSGGPKEPCIRWGPDLHTWWGNFEDTKRSDQDMPRHVHRLLKVTQQGPQPVWHRCRLGCTRWGCKLATPGEYDWTILCGSDAALCQITFTTFYYWLLLLLWTTSIHKSTLTYNCIFIINKIFQELAQS